MDLKKENPFVGYEYKQVSVPSDQVSMYMDCYENFGWEPEERIVTTGETHRGSTVTIRMRRNRKILNKMELTRLQRQFEACTQEIDALERSKTSAATVWALGIGLMGTACMAGSVFAVTHQPPIYWLCMLLAVPAFAGWIAPYFVYRRKVETQTRKLEPLIEAKQEEIYTICEKGHSLL